LTGSSFKKNRKNRNIAHLRKWDLSGAVGDKSDQARLLYVGMTRAREMLILTASAPNSFTDRLQSLATA